MAPWKPCNIWLANHPFYSPFTRLSLVRRKNPSQFCPGEPAEVRASHHHCTERQLMTRGPSPVILSSKSTNWHCPDRHPPGSLWLASGPQQDRARTHTHTHPHTRHIHHIHTDITTVLCSLHKGDVKKMSDRHRYKRLAKTQQPQRTRELDHNFTSWSRRCPPPRTRCRSGCPGTPLLGRWRVHSGKCWRWCFPAARRCREALRETNGCYRNATGSALAASTVNDKIFKT